MRIQRAYRLRQRTDINRIRKHGSAVRHPMAVLLTIANTTAANASVAKALDGEDVKIRIGFSASRRVGNAVQRNRAKRLFREAVRPHIPNLLPGYDMLFLLRKRAASASYPEVLAAVNSLFDRANLWRD